MKIYQYDLDGNYVAEYKNIDEAEFIIKGQHISKVLSKNRYYKNFYWTKTYYIKYPDEMKNTDKMVFQYDSEGNYVKTFNNIKEASVKLDIEASNISKSLTGPAKSYKGMIFKKYKVDKLSLSDTKIKNDCKLQICLSEELHTKLLNMSEEQNITMAAVIRNILEKA